MEWIYLFIAGVMEVGWPLGFKLSQTNGEGVQRYLWIGFSILSMAGSGFFLWLAQRDIPMGTAYAIWTGVGAAGTFLIGIVFFKDPASTGRILSAFLIVAGIVGMKLSS